MSDSSQPTPPSKINIVSIASDDDLWVLETDLDQLLQVLADPVGWVNANVVINGAPAVLWQPFVVVFQEISASGDDPTILVQGINETAVLTVQYVQTSPPPAPVELFPASTSVSILQTGTTVYTHLELTDFTPTQVANTMYTAVTSPETYFAAFNQLPQVSNGQLIPIPNQMVFTQNRTLPIQYLYQGWTPQPSENEKPHHRPHDPKPPLACDMSIGDADQSGNVIVNNVIIKTYTLGP